MNFSYSIFLTSLSIFSYTLLIFHPDYCFVFCLSTNSWYLLSVLYNFIVFLLFLFVDSLFINFLTVSCLSFLLHLFLSPLSSSIHSYSRKMLYRRHAAVHSHIRSSNSWNRFCLYGSRCSTSFLSSRRLPIGDTEWWICKVRTVPCTVICRNWIEELNKERKR